MIRFVGVVLFLTLVSACSSAKRENIQPPRKLESFTSTVSVQRLWSRSVGDVGGKPGLAMSASYLDGRLYAANTRGAILTLDAASGREIARIDTRRSISTTPGVGDGVVAVGTLDGELLVYDLASGGERFSARLSSEALAAPVVAEGRVFVRTIDGRVSAYFLADGTRSWVHESLVPPLTLRGNGTPRYDRGYLLVGQDDGRVVALRADDGSEVWQQTVSAAEGRTDLDRLSDVDGEFAISDGIAYVVGYRGQAMAIDVALGRPLWARDLSAATGVADGSYLFVSDAEGKVWALDRNNGDSMWSQDALERRWLSTPAYAGGHVAVGDLEGYVHWLRRDDGELAARQRVSRDPIRAAPFAVGDTVYVMSTGGTLAAYRVGG